MKNVFAIIFVVISFFSTNAYSRNTGCDFKILVSDRTEIRVYPQDTSIRKLSPQFFGFNLELLEFQDSLWNKQKGSVENEAIALLSRFPGATYRYPGGTVSNHFIWEQAVGPLAERAAQKTVSYQPEKVISFGPIEFLKFIQQVNGTAWYVLNMNGSISAEYSSKILAQSAAKLAQNLKSAEHSGLPQIYRWELGNELDRGKYRWPPEKYVTTATEVANAVRATNTGAEFVVMGQDWEHTGAGRLGTTYNAYTATALEDTADEYSFHLYYDGAPWGPPLPRVIKQLCKNTAATQLPIRPSNAWVTEFGKAPVGTPLDSYWKSNWPQTGGLSAAISAADLLITLARIDRVDGAFVHSLHATSGPWPIFHKRTDGVIYPSAVYWALVMLRETMLEDVLNSDITTLNSSDNGVGYDTNSIVMASPSRLNISIWTAQRGDVPARISTVIPQLAGKKVLVKFASLSSPETDANNYVSQYQVFPRRNESIIQVGHTGDFVYTVPAHSVTSLSLEVIPNK